MIFKPGSQVRFLNLTKQKSPTLRQEAYYTVESNTISKEGIFLNLKNQIGQFNADDFEGHVYFYVNSEAIREAIIQERKLEQKIQENSAAKDDKKFEFTDFKKPQPNPNNKNKRKP